MIWSENKEQCEARKEQAEYSRMHKLAMSEKKNEGQRKTWDKKCKDKLRFPDRLVKI
jgi:hypothetical protein